MQPETVFTIILFIIFADYVWERFLDYLNSTKWSDKLPSELEGIYDEDKYQKSQQYEKEKQKFSFVTDTFSFILILLMLLMGGFAYIDGFIRSITTDPVWMSLFFFGIIGLAADILFLPFSIYGTFVIEQKYGFNKTTATTFAMDKLKGWLLGAILGGGILALVVWIYSASGEWFWLVAWVALGVFMVFMSMFYSNLIVPLFNKQKPLEKGELRDAIESFSASIGFKLKNIYVMDGSKRSTKANAYFTGLGPKKRIVLFDTLIENHSKEELVAVLAHEIGHYKSKHTTLGLALSLLQTGIMLFVLSLFIGNPVLSQALGAEKGSFHMGLLAFGLLYSPLSLLLGWIFNKISRKNEYAADHFAGKNYNADALILALKKLSVDNLSNLRPHPLYVQFYYSHPPLLKRIHALRTIKN